MALLAAFATGRAPGQDRIRYLIVVVFAQLPVASAEPDPADVAGFDAYITRFVDALPAERTATGLAR